MPPARLESAITPSEPPQPRALDRTATGICSLCSNRITSWRGWMNDSDLVLFHTSLILDVIVAECRVLRFWHLAVSDIRWLDDPVDPVSDWLTYRLVLLPEMEYQFPDRRNCNLFSCLYTEYAIIFYVFILQIQIYCWKSSEKQAYCKLPRRIIEIERVFKISTVWSTIKHPIDREDFGASLDDENNSVF